MRATTEEPIHLALREIAEAKRLLETLIVSSESFDYVGAKAALLELDAKVRVLSRVEAQLVAQLPAPTSFLIPFPILAPEGRS